MKKLITLCLGIFIAIMLVSCSSQGTKETNTISANLSELQQKDAEIRVDPPKGWEPVAGSVLPVQYLKNTSSFMVKEEFFKDKTLDDVISEAKSAFENAFDDVVYNGEPKVINIDGKDARQLLFTCTISGLKMKYEYVYLIVDGKVYAITFGSPADTFDSLSGDYEQILTDIKF